MPRTEKDAMETVPTFDNSRRSVGIAASGTNSFDARNISIVPQLP
jgi:hypothetical protein